MHLFFFKSRSSLAFKSTIITRYIDMSQKDIHRQNLGLPDRKHSFHAVVAKQHYIYSKCWTVRVQRTPMFLQVAASTANTVPYRPLSCYSLSLFLIAAWTLNTSRSHFPPQTRPLRLLLPLLRRSPSFSSQYVFFPPSLCIVLCHVEAQAFTVFLEPNESDCAGPQGSA